MMVMMCLGAYVCRADRQSRSVCSVYVLNFSVTFDCIEVHKGIGMSRPQKLCTSYVRVNVKDNVTVT